MRLGALVRYRQTASRLACLPALAVLAVPLVAARYAPEARMVVECGALFMVCLVQTVRPTLLGWAIVLVWFALWSFETVSLALHPGYRRVLPVALVLVPTMSLLSFRPRAEANERGAWALALLVGLVVVTPLFVV